jgi:hypothetical protein
MNELLIELLSYSCFNTRMSTEKLINTEQQNFNQFSTPQFEEKKVTARVDINELLAKVREEKKKETKINLVLFSMFASLIVVVGLILSF